MPWDIKNKLRGNTTLIGIKEYFMSRANSRFLRLFSVNGYLISNIRTLHEIKKCFINFVFKSQTFK